MSESAEHAALIELFRHNPELAAKLVARSGRIVVPGGCRARVADPAQRHWTSTPDVLIELLDSGGSVKLVIIVEIQRAVDRNKPWDWPANLWFERRRRRCDCVVLVIATTPEVAAWAARPLHCGPDSVTRILVLAAKDVPWITDIAEARACPALAVLSAAMHGEEPGGDVVRRVAADCLFGLHVTETIPYNHLVFRTLSEQAILAILEDHVQSVPAYRKDPAYAGWCDFLDHLAHRMATLTVREEVLLKLIKNRGFRLSKARREKIEACRDPDRLDTWIARTGTAASVREIFAD